MGLFKTKMPIFFGKILQWLQYDVISPLTDDILFSGNRFIHNKHEMLIKNKANYQLLPKNASGYVFDLCFSDSCPVYELIFNYEKFSP